MDTLDPEILPVEAVRRGFDAQEFIRPNCIDTDYGFNEGPK